MKPKPRTKRTPTPTPASRGWRAAWDKVNEYRHARELPLFGYRYANDPHVAPLMAGDLKTIEDAAK